MAFEVPKVVYKVPHTKKMKEGKPNRRDVWPQKLGVYTFARSITLGQVDSFGGKDYLYEPAYNTRDTLRTDGLELIPDYATSILFQKKLDVKLSWPVQHTYPVCVVNSTPHAKTIFGKDSWLYAIQEAKDREGRWRPIETHDFDFCGNGEWALQLRPQRMFVFLVKKYEGSFNTLLRVRLQNGPTRYVSTSYAGQIDERQFKPSAWEYKALKTDRLAAEHLYYGARPAVLEDTTTTH